MSERTEPNNTPSTQRDRLPNSGEPFDEYHPEDSFIDSYTSFDGDSFDYQGWNTQGQLHTVIIGTHGINGAASDYSNLAFYLSSQKQGIALYAHNTRGQGLDKDEQRRGHIDHPTSWFRDLKIFTRIIRKKHPHCRIIWMGESMGALISTLAHVSQKERSSISYHPNRTNLTTDQCDALIISSPVISIQRHIAPWQQSLFHIVASLLPHYKIQLESLTDNTQVQVAQGTVHTKQASTNHYHVKSHSLALLSTLAKLIKTMPNIGHKLSVPTLLLQGGKDFFSSEEEVQDWHRTFSTQALHTRHFYPEAYHLLMYDKLRERVFSDILTWIRQLENIKKS